MQAIASSRRWRVLIAVALAAAVGFTFGNTEAVGAGSTTEVVYIATGDNFPDALGAGAVAGVNAGPVLLVQQNAIPAPILAELNRLQPERIIIVGGTGVISDSVESALESLGFGPTVERIAGADRYATAAALSAASFPVTTGDIFHVNSGTGATLVTTTAWTEVATGQVIVPEGETAYLVVTYNAESSCYGADIYCFTRVLVNGTEIDPAAGSGYAFDSSDNNTETSDSWEAHVMVRVTGPLDPGTYDIAVEAGVGAGGTFRLDDWTLVVEGKKT